MDFCIPKPIASEVEKIFKLPTSIERMNALRVHFDEKQAQQLNLAYERTRQSIHVESSLARLIKKLNLTEAEKADILAKAQSNIERRNGIVDEQELESIIKDIFDRKYKLNLTLEQASQIGKIDKELRDAKALGLDKNGNYSLKYGAAMEDMSQLVNKIQNPGSQMTLGKQFSSELTKLKEENKLIQGKYEKTAHAVGSASKFILTLPFKTLKASLDASFLGIQGLNIATRNPSAFIESTKKAISTLTDKNAIEAFRINTYSWGGYEDAIKAGLRLIKPEEQFYSNVAERVPFIGGAVKKSDEAFSIFLQNARKAEYQRVLTQWQSKLGRKLDASMPEDLKLMKEIADHANKVTGTSNLGYFEKYANGINNILFAGRYAVSDLRQFTDILDPTISPQARKLAAETLGRNIGALYGLYVVIAATNPGRTELNPNSANFMKVKDNNGVWVGPKLKGQWIIQLTAKLLQQEEKNASGKIIKYGEGYKGKTGLDVVARTFRGKLAPIPALAGDLLDQKDFSGKPITIGGELVNLVGPISVSDILTRMFQAKEPAAEQIQTGFYDAVGLSEYKVGQ